VTPRAQVFVAFVTIAMVIFILRLVRRRQLRAKYSFLWITIGFATLLLAALPRTFDRVARDLGVASAPNLFFFVAIAVLLLVIVHFSWELTRLEDRTRMLAEDLALLRVELGEAADRDPNGATAAAAEAEADA